MDTMGSSFTKRTPGLLPPESQAMCVSAAACAVTPGSLSSCDTGLLSTDFSAQGPIGTPPTLPPLLAGALAAASRSLAASALSLASSRCTTAVFASCGAASLPTAPADCVLWSARFWREVLVLS